MPPCDRLRETVSTAMTQGSSAAWIGDIKRVDFLIKPDFGLKTKRTPDFAIQYFAAANKMCCVAAGTSNWPIKFEAEISDLFAPNSSAPTAAARVDSGKFAN